MIAAELKMLIICRLVRSPSARSQIAGAARNCEVRRVTLSGFESVVRRVIVEDRRILQVVSVKPSEIGMISPACLSPVDSSGAEKRVGLTREADQLA